MAPDRPVEQATAAPGEYRPSLTPEATLDKVVVHFWIAGKPGKVESFGLTTDWLIEHPDELCALLIDGINKLAADA